MYTIALRGVSNTGKTETLIELSKLLVKKYSFDLTIVRKDAYCIGTINDKRVSVITAGDDRRALERYIGYLKIKDFWKPDFLVIACHKGSTSEYLISSSDQIEFVDHIFLSRDEYDIVIANRLHKKESKKLLLQLMESID